MVSFLVKKAGKMEYNLRNISEEFFASSYEEFFDEPFKHDFTPISRCIDPWHFVRSREVRGGTGEKAMESMIERAKKETKLISYGSMNIENSYMKRMKRGNR